MVSAQVCTLDEFGNLQRAHADATDGPTAVKRARAATHYRNAAQRGRVRLEPGHGLLCCAYPPGLDVREAVFLGAGLTSHQAGRAACLEPVAFDDATALRLPRADGRDLVVELPEFPGARRPPPPPDGCRWAKQHHVAP